MGLAASQARYLALTARKSDLEFQSQTINTRRIQLAYRTAEIAQAYSEGMNNRMISVSDKNNEGDTIWKDATFGNLLELKDLVVIPTAGGTWHDIGVDKNAPYKDGGTEEAIAYYATSDTAKYTADQLNDWGIDMSKVSTWFSVTEEQNGDTTVKSYTLNGVLSTENYDALPQAVKSKYTASKAASYKLSVRGDYNGFDLNTLLTDARAQVVTKAFYDYLRSCGYDPLDQTKGISSVEFARLQTLWENNENNVNIGGQDAIVDWRADEKERMTQRNYTEDDAKVLAEYERATAEVQAQDKMLEVQEKNIETQHKAIETELESIQKVIQQNIEKTFKIFS